MKVILMKDIKALGDMGAVVDVANGYARNYLIPQGLAKEATKGNLAQVEQAKSKYMQVKAKEQEGALARAAALAGLSLTFAQRVAEEEKLYGSVTAAMIIEALEAKGHENETQATGPAGAHQKVGQLRNRGAPGPGGQGHDHRGSGGRIEAKFCQPIGERSGFWPPLQPYP